jgi:integrase
VTTRPHRAAGLRVIARANRGGALTITGTVAGQRIRRRAQSDDPRLAREEAAALEAELLRTQWHGQRRGTRPFAAAVTSYVEAAPRSEADRLRLNRILVAIGNPSLGEIDQDTLSRLRTALLRPTAGPATFRREIPTPVRAVLNYAHERGWCDAPVFVAPKESQGRTLYLLPAEAERLIAAAPHLRVLLLLLLGTGARMGEALRLEWRDVDLACGRAILWKTKNGRRRDVTLPPRLVAALAALPYRDGPVIRWARQQGRSARGCIALRRLPRISPARRRSDQDRLGGGDPPRRPQPRADPA